MGRRGRRERARHNVGPHHHTRPAVFEGRPIPEVLTGGDHAKVRAWRRAEAERLTRERRPDLWTAYQKKQQDP